MNVPVHVIEPCGFPFSKRALQRYAMDYADIVDLRHHADWDTFEALRHKNAQRLILLTTGGATDYSDFVFEKNDILLVGSESTGAPDFVHDAAHARVTVPMAKEARSLNVAISMAMVLGEAMRQTATWPHGQKTRGTPLGY